MAVMIRRRAAVREHGAAAVYMKTRAPMVLAAPDVRLIERDEPHSALSRIRSDAFEQPEPRSECARQRSSRVVDHERHHLNSNTVRLWKLDPA